MKSIVEIYKMTQEELFNCVLEEINKHSDKLIIKQEIGKYIISIPIVDKKLPYLVSHLDIVGSIPPKRVVLDSNNNYIGFNEYFERNILGGDDRNGVYTMLKLFEDNFDKMGFIFTCDEEVGALGSQYLVKSNINLNKLVSYFIQIDRRGTNDLAFYYSFNTLQNNLMTESFENVLYNFRDYNLTMGSFTDIKLLCEKYLISGINISAGYFNEHTELEYTSKDYLDSLPDIVLNLIELLNENDNNYDLEFDQKSTNLFKNITINKRYRKNDRILQNEI